MTASTALETLASASSEIHSATRGIADHAPELGGIRGVAILVVMLFHYASLTPGLPFHGLACRVQAAFRLGWSGVGLFFVLSGFLEEFCSAQ